MQTVTIKEKSGITLIDVFSVDPKNQDKLVQIMVEVTEKTLKHIPGFISMSVHKSLDGKRVTNYEQWESVKHCEMMYQNTEVRQHIQKAVAIAKADITSLSSVLYTVEHVNSGDGKD